MGLDSGPNYNKIMELKKRGLVSQTTVTKAVRLVLTGAARLEKDAGGGIYFSVKSRSLYQVSFNRKSKKWFCDCRYFSVHPGRYCSHILAASLLMDRPDKNLK